MCKWGLLAQRRPHREVQRETNIGGDAMARGTCAVLYSLERVATRSTLVLSSSGHRTREIGWLRSVTVVGK